MEHTEIQPPPEFYKIINDFTSDIVTTFPEYSSIISRWWNRPSDDLEKSRKNETLLVFRHCSRVFPQQFFDILYKNADIFDPEKTSNNTQYLPGIVFAQLWNADISDSTRDTIWKYLQLILFSVVGTSKDASYLENASKMFESINEEELKSKLEETLEGMKTLFEQNNSGDDKENPNPQQMFDVEGIREHLDTMMKGKLGKLAFELAEETANELNLDLDNNSTSEDVFKKLLGNPTKLMSLATKVSNKLDAKMKSGEINQSELTEEAMEMFGKMKDMPGLDNIQQMLSQMNIPGLGKGAKLNMSAMEAQLKRQLNSAKMKDRLRAKASASNTAQRTDGFVTGTAPTVSEEEAIRIFSTGEKPMKTPRGAQPQPQPQAQPKKSGKKKGKK